MGVDWEMEAASEAAQALALEREAGQWRRYSPFTLMDDGRVFCDACMRAWAATVTVQLDDGPVTLTAADGRCPGCGLTEAVIKPQALGISPPPLA